MSTTLESPAESILPEADILDEQAFDEHVQKNLSWNFSVNLMDLSFIIFAGSLVSRETVIPVLINQLTDSKLAIGLLVAIYAAGVNLPQLFIANHSEGMRYKLPFVKFWGGWFERGPYFLIGLFVWFFAMQAPSMTVVFILLMLAVSAFGMGIATPAWYDIIAKAIPVERRGIFSGIGHGLGAFIGIAGAYFVGVILDAFDFPNNFAILFVVASFFMFISWIGLALNREPASLKTKERIELSEYLKDLPQILQTNANYSRFLISRALVHLGAMSIGFFMVYGTERFDIDGAGVGLLTGIMIGSKAATNLLWGLIGDRYGHKSVLTGAAFAVALAALIAWMASSFWWLAVTFVLLGAYLAADEVSALNIILEFCVPEDRPTYIGLTNTLFAPFMIVAPLVGGWLTDVSGYRPMFAVALVVGLIGSLMLAFWVREPREA
ncbi:MAG: MFS transporter [Chloroflexota bacterium]